MPKKRKGSKKEAQERHFKRRIVARYDVEDAEDFMVSALKQIHSNNSVCIENQSNRVKVHKVSYNGTDIFVVYDKERKSLVTALEPGWVQADVHL